MVSTNFDLAPPAAVVDGLAAVPIDIQRVTASLVFDGETASGDGDAAVDFVMGPQNGFPIFGLRQAITGVWLDGLPVPVGQLAHHDFGGGADAQLRVVESPLNAGSSHTLRVTYTLGPPQASMAGSYQPAMTWSAGPRLAFNFGFTDLGAGRYLEAWVPANLIFDQFDLDLELQILNTPIAHVVITNGTVTTVGANHWTVKFPPRFTALSPLLELRAGDTVVGLTGSTTLPVSGSLITIEAWKLAAGTVDLAAQIANLKTWLAANEISTGAYLHGSRFVAILHLGGMEYEGGTTSGAGALRHETFHSWWARGLKPASQADAWWDEAWTVYHDLGATGSLPFDFTDPPVALCPRNPWVRITNNAAYSAGERFFEGAAALIGVANLNALLRDFFAEHASRPATTAELEAFLVRRSGDPRLVDAFHRFVYGFPDPAPAPDLWFQDDPAHTGSNSWSGRFWDSPDLWIRNADDDGTTHQSVEHGQDNWFYARVRNGSTTATARHFLISFNVKPFVGMEFQYPADFLPATAATAGFELGPGASTIVKARWPAALVPPAGTHACWLAAILTRFDHPGSGLHAWEHNNLGQKNLIILDVAPDQWCDLPFVINRFPQRGRHSVLLELVRPETWEGLEAVLRHRSGAIFDAVPDARRRSSPLPPAPAQDALQLDCGGSLSSAAISDDAHLSFDLRASVARQFDGMAEVVFAPGRVSQLPLELSAQGQALLDLRLHIPPAARPGERLTFDLVQRSADGKRILGGLTVDIGVSDDA
jgi:hypothetical protein